MKTHRNHRTRRFLGCQKSPISKHKKGVISVQINWIFVLIVGGLILAFFVGLIVKQKTISETKQALTLREDLDAIFASSGVATGTANLITVPDIEVHFDCTDCNCKYYVGEFDQSIDKALSEYRVVFAPEQVKGKQLITWAMSWNLPYKITDFLYVTSTNIRYVIAYEGDPVNSNQNYLLAQRVFDDLPDEMIKGEEVVSADYADTVENQNYDSVRYVFFVDDINLPTDKVKFAPDDTFIDDKNVQITAVTITPIGGVAFFGYERGSRNNFVKIPTDRTYQTEYIDYNPSYVQEKNYPSLYGAIFATSPEQYTCMMTRAFRRHKFITNIMRSRVEEFSKKSYPVLGCGLIYGTAGGGALGTIDSLLEKVSRTDCSGSFSSDCRVGTLPRDIEKHNLNLQQHSCPLIY